MILHELLEMAAFAKVDLGMGLSELSNDSFVLSGGYRSGNSSSGQTRLKYDVYDMELYNTSKDATSSKIGFVELFVNDDGNITGLVNIEILPKFRKTGKGARLVKDITDSTHDGLNIHDIQKKAKKFWDKAGVQYHTKTGQDGIIPKS